MILNNQTFKLTQKDFDRCNISIKINSDQPSFRTVHKPDWSPYKKGDTENINKYKHQTYYNLYLLQDDKKDILLDYVGINNESMFLNEMTGKIVLVTQDMLLNTMKSTACEYYNVYVDILDYGVADKIYDK